MKLHIHLYDALAIEVDIEGDRSTDRTITTYLPAQHLSAAWMTKPTAEQLDLWLLGALPENGAQDAWVAAASAARLDAGLSPVSRGPADIIWGNTDAEYPGAVSFAREPTPPTWKGPYAALTDAEIGERLAWNKTLTHLYHAPTQFLATSYGYDTQNRQVALQLRAQG